MPKRTEHKIIDGVELKYCLTCGKWLSLDRFGKPEDIDFGRCWALTNLQLLPASDNLSKGNKLKEPFQPSFIFG